MAALFLLICCSAILLGISVIAIFLGSYLLGRPLSKGCGKPDCCQKITKNTWSQSDSKTKASPNDDAHSS
ncbi:hypothetical protein [Chlamydia gallinacea]|uniref:FeoB-associated Cys-rich membrane protein n=1 Tax=Chlamydia gallinacea TaxID=1457153 RepID=A0ABS7IRX7_9CHLA|nr:hypothetical protein [Chlamydia gallinacea]MBX6679873.1 hypothetical protein [Chlamydia gallinacea]MBX6687105.1 hypothetical protein [Chlamydia gallinacea]